jgi:DNA adenine methylase
VNSDPASTENVEVVVSYRDTPSILIVDLGVFGKIAVTMKEWIQLIDALPRIKDPSQKALLSLPGRLREICLKMRLAGVVKYDAKSMHWKIDSRELKIYRFLPHAPTVPAKTTRLPPATPVKPEVKAETTPLVSELAKEILEHVVEKHGVGKPTKPFRYAGGDWFIKDEILDVLVKSNCDTLVEVFGGSGVISMYAPREVFKKIIYNDIDPLLVNFFTVLKEKPAELSKKIALIPVSRETTNKYAKMLKTGEIHKLDPVEKAAVYFYLIRTTMFSQLDQFSPRASTNTAVRIRKHATLIPEYAKMWRDIVIENADFRDLIRKYDAENAVFYCDPPFLSTSEVERDYYRFAFTDRDMKDLLNVLSSIKGKFVLKLPEDHLEIRYIREWIEKNSYRVKTVKHPRYMEKAIGEKRTVQKTMLIYNFLVL